MLQLDERTDAIVSDRQSGSTGILDQCIEMFMVYLEESILPEPENIIKNMKRILKVHASMAVLIHFFNALLLHIEKENLLREKDNTKEILLKFLREYRQKWNQTGKKIAGFLLKQEELNEKTILLHSNSSVMVRVFCELAENNISPKIYQTISYPAGEGKVQAAKLAKCGFEVNMIADAAVASQAGNIDMVLFGSDAVSPDYFVNKTGTHLYADFFHHLGKKAYVIADSRKMLDAEKLPSGLRKSLEKETLKDPSELWMNPPPKVDVINFYFEKIPNNTINGFITESGVFDNNSLKEAFIDFRVSDLFIFEDQE